MYRYLYIILICLFSDIFCQGTNGDTFFLDMGVVIKSENKRTNSNGLIDSTPIKQSNHVIQKKDAGSIYMATTSDLISTIDRITNQVTDIEKEFESKLDKLEIENSNLRNQIVSLKQRLNSEILDTKSIEADLVKPETNSSIPVSYTHLTLPTILRV